MTLIKISDLTTADIKLSVSADSFLNELQKAETTQIFGGGSKSSCCYYEEPKDDCWHKEKEECDYSYKEKRDYSYNWCHEKEC